MFSFFKPKKSQAPTSQDSLRQSVDELRAQFSDEALSKGIALNERMNRLHSVKAEFFNGLMGVTGDVSDRFFPLFNHFRLINTLEAHAFCASVVASGVKASLLPEDERSTIIDIYIDLWVGSIAAQGPVDGDALKTSISRLWQEYLPGILRTAVDGEVETPGFPHPPLTLMQTVDRVCGVDRPERDQIEAAETLKETVIHALLAVRALKS